MGERQPTDPPLFYETHVFVCAHRRPDCHPRGCCGSKGAETFGAYLSAQASEQRDPRIRINKAACMDRCELGPCAVIYPEGVWYRLDSRGAADAILANHIKQQTRLPELMIDLPE